MKNKVTILLCLILTVGLISSCKKDDDDKPRKDLLTGSTCWKITKYEERDDKGNFVDFTNDTYDACELDDCTRFGADGNYVNTDSGVKCDPDNSILEEGTWSLIDGDKKIVMTPTGLGFSVTFTIESITANTLVVTTSFIGPELRITYKN